MQALFIQMRLLKEPNRGLSAMLKNLNTLLTADVLHLLASMGHGDELAIVDRNYPAASNAKRHIHFPAASSTDVLNAVLDVFPVDTFVDPVAFRMEVVDQPKHVPDICNEFSALLLQHEKRSIDVAPLDRFAFYKRSQNCFGIISTGEIRPYGNIILIKGVV